MKKTWPWVSALIAFVCWFGYWETMAFIHPESYSTLSYTVSSIAAKWPFFIVLVSFTAGTLSAHFFWPWAANPLGKGGG